MMLFLLTLAIAEPIILHKSTTARCNDGTPFSYLVREVPDAPWFIYLRGGGFCDDGWIGCSTRVAGSTTRMMDGASVASFPDSTGIFTMLDGYSVAVGLYCSSDLWSGDLDYPVSTSAGSWFFQGRRAVEAMIGELDLDDSDRVIFAGSSAGCFGVYANADLIPGAVLVADGCYLPADSLDAARVDHALSLWGSTLTSVYAVDYADLGAWTLTSDDDEGILGPLGLTWSQAWADAIWAEANERTIIHEGSHKYLLDPDCVTSGVCAELLAQSLY